MNLEKREMWSGQPIFGGLAIVGGSAIFFSMLANMYPSPCTFCSRLLLVYHIPAVSETF